MVKSLVDDLKLYKLRRMNLAKQPQSLLKKLQWTLSALAMVACLYSVSSIHNHEAGYHNAGSDCISCSLEEVTAHGSMTSQSVAISLRFVETHHQTTANAAFISVYASVFEPRAPPFSLI